MHESYTPPSIYHDIAVVTLEDKIRFNQFVQPVCLPGKRMFGDLMIEQTVMVSGYGDLSFGGRQAMRLQEVDLKVINNSYCDDNYKRLSESQRKFGNGIGKTLICAGHERGGKDACQVGGGFQHKFLFQIKNLFFFKKTG